MADILAGIGEGARKTRIMYSANLNHRQIDRYLERLKRQALVGYDPTTRRYQLLETGSRFLRVFGEIRGLKDFVESRKELLWAQLRPVDQSLNLHSRDRLNAKLLISAGEQSP